jgi:hypothetical protein
VLHFIKLSAKSFLFSHVCFCRSQEGKRLRILKTKPILLSKISFLNVGQLVTPPDSYITVIERALIHSGYELRQSFFSFSMGWDLRHLVLWPLLAYCTAPDD